MYVDISTRELELIAALSLSQLIGSTLALQYLRAEYVAPLGSTSLIFNFLFASLLVGTPVTSTDIYVSLSLRYHDIRF